MLQQVYSRSCVGVVVGMLCFVDTGIALRQLAGTADLYFTHNNITYWQACC